MSKLVDIPNLAPGAAEYVSDWKFVIPKDRGKKGRYMVEITHAPSNCHWVVDAQKDASKVEAFRDIKINLIKANDAELLSLVTKKLGMFYNTCQRLNENEGNEGTKDVSTCSNTGRDTKVKAVKAISAKQVKKTVIAAPASKKNPEKVPAKTLTPTKQKKPKRKAPEPTRVSPTRAAKSAVITQASALLDSEFNVDDAADPEPPKGKKGEGNARFIWDQWAQRQKERKKKETKKALESQKLKAIAEAKEAQRTKIKLRDALVATKTGSTVRIPLNAKKKVEIAAVSKAPAKKVNTSSTTQNEKRKEFNVDVEEEEQVTTGQDASRSTIDVIDDSFRMATRAPSKTGKGRSRIVGKSKQSSASDDKDAHAAANEPPRKKAMPATDNNMMKITGEASSGLAILAGAETLFRAQRVGSKGLREGKKNTQRSAVVPTAAELSLFEKTRDQIDPLAMERELSVREYIKGAHHWLWQLQLNFSVLLFGVGCKEKLLNCFVKENLSGEDVVMIDGNRVDIAGTGSRTVRALLDTISETILKQPHLGTACTSLDGYAHCVTEALQRNYNRTPRSMYANMFGAAGASLQSGLGAGGLMLEKGTSVMTEDASVISDQDCLPPPPPMARSDSFRWDDASYNETQPRMSRFSSVSSKLSLDGDADPSWGGRFTHAKAKLYVVVHSIDGDCLQQEMSQRILAALAECPSVSVIATCDKVNAPLLWSNDLLAKFRWCFQHVPTFASYPIRANFALLSGQKGGPVPHSQGLEYILGSLTTRHKELLEILAKEKLKGGTSDSKGGGEEVHSKSTTYEELLTLSIKAMIVQTSNQLATFLKELEDHRLVSVTTDSAKTKVVDIKLSRDTLEKLVR